MDYGSIALSRQESRNPGWIIIHHGALYLRMHCKVEKDGLYVSIYNKMRRIANCEWIGRQLLVYTEGSYINANGA